MEEASKLDLGSVQETLLLPLWGRAMETQKNRPLLIDTKAVEILKAIPYDFSVISQNISPISRQHGLREVFSSMQPSKRSSDNIPMQRL